MANITKNHTIPPLPPPITYSIVLSEGEANGLAALLYCGVSHTTLEKLQILDLQMQLSAQITDRYRNFTEIAKVE
jgi:hypothetical protein